jgi:hypothetical protein
LKKLFLFLLLSAFCIIPFESARAISFEGAFSDPIIFPEGCSVQKAQLSLDDYDASRYTIDDFIFTGKFSNPKINGDGLNIWMKLPDAGTDEWQWLGQMVNMPQGDPVELTFGITDPNWQPLKLNEALGEDGVLTMKLEGYGGGGYVLNELSLKIEATELPSLVPELSPSSVPEPASVLLLGSSLIGLAGIRRIVNR